MHMLRVTHGHGSYGSWIFFSAIAVILLLFIGDISGNNNTSGCGSQIRHVFILTVAASSPPPLPKRELPESKTASSNKKYRQRHKLPLESVKEQRDQQRRLKTNHAPPAVVQEAWRTLHSKATTHITYNTENNKPFIHNSLNRTLAEQEIPQNDAFRPIRMYLDTSHLTELRSDADEQQNAKIDALIDTILPRVHDVWTRALMVMPSQSDLTTNFGRCFEALQNDRRWRRRLDEGVNGNLTSGDEGVFEFRSNDDRGVSSSRKRRKLLSQISSSIVYKNIDLVIIVTAYNRYDGERVCNTDQDDVGSGQLAFAFTCELDQNDRPLMGTMNICLDAIQLVEEPVDGDTSQEANMSSSSFAKTASTASYSSNNASSKSNIQYTLLREQIDATVGTAIHEIGHVLGFNAELYKFYRNANTGEPLTPRPFVTSNQVTCVNDQVMDNVIVPSRQTLRKDYSSTGHLYYEFVTPTVTNVVRNHFNCPTLTGARLENQPTNPSDCFGSHYDERLFFTEGMSAVYNPSTSTLSPLTLALMEDTGWYKANFQNTNISPFGHGAGCPFVNDDCIINGGVVPDSSKGFFCSTILQIDNKLNDQQLTGFPTCDPSHTKMSLCDLIDAREVSYDIDWPHHYFDNMNLGPRYFLWADFCPIPHLITTDCRDESQNDSPHNIPGEEFSKSSMCFNAKLPSPSLVKSSSSNNPPSNSGSNTMPYSLCLKARCNKDYRILEINVDGRLFRCAKDFQTHQHPSLSGVTFECPRFSAACPDLVCPSNCSGKGVCNHETGKCTCFNNQDESFGCYGMTTPSNSKVDNNFNNNINDDGLNDNDDFEVNVLDLPPLSSGSAAPGTDQRTMLPLLMLGYLCCF